MYMKKTLLAAVIVFGSVSLAQAAAPDQGSGRITFQGSIIDAPCSIKPDSATQTVQLGQISNVALKNGGKSEPRSFKIELEGCDFEKSDGKNKVSVSFNGTESAGIPNMLGISGSASGASVVITDGAGTPLKLGEASKAQALLEGDNSLQFSAYLQGDGASATIVPGKFQAWADFKLAYN